MWDASLMGRKKRKCPRCGKKHKRVYDVCRKCFKEGNGIPYLKDNW